MASQKQIEANRRNAQKSTGPKTYAGKLQSRANALKHGMAALHCPLAHEETSNYHTMRAGLMETYEPANTQELMLVDNIASAWIGMQRAERFEASFMATFVEDIKYRCDKPNKGPWATDDTGIAILMAKDNLENAWITLDRYQRRANSAYYRAIEALRKTQAERRRKVLDEIRTGQEHQKYLKKTVADPGWQPDPMPEEGAKSKVSPIPATQMGSFGQTHQQPASVENHPVAPSAMKGDKLRNGGQAGTPKRHPDSYPPSGTLAGAKGWVPCILIF